MEPCEKPPLAADTASAAAFETRSLALDVARGIAVLGMIYMHLVPTEGAQTVWEQYATGLARLLEGKSAALFCVLAGMTWGLQASRAAESTEFPRYVARRAVSLALAGFLFHVTLWPTEILLPLALMMVLSLVLLRLGPKALLLAMLLLLAAAPLIPARLGDWILLDWNEDGSHAADHVFGGATLRFYLFDGNYPLLPWLAFPLLGMLLVERGWVSTLRSRTGFMVTLPLSILMQRYADWAAANSILLGDRAAYLTSTWVPTSLPFMLVTGCAAVTVIAGLLWWESARGLPRLFLPFSLLGRASLTHYILHIALVFAPLRLSFPQEDWSVAVGVKACILYLALALPLTALWFRHASRGPLESVWAVTSGRSR